MKVKAYELLKMIAEGKIKEGTKLINKNRTEFEYSNECLYRVGYCGEKQNIFNGCVYSEIDYFVKKEEFEILENKTEEIDEIPSVARDELFIDNDKIDYEQLRYILNEIIEKENKVIRVVNKLNKQDTAKETQCMTD